MFGKPQGTLHYAKVNEKHASRCKNTSHPKVEKADQIVAPDAPIVNEEIGDDNLTNIRKELTQAMSKYKNSPHQPIKAEHLEKMLNNPKLVKKWVKRGIIIYITFIVFTSILGAIF